MHKRWTLSAASFNFHEFACYSRKLVEVELDRTCDLEDKEYLYNHVLDSQHLTFTCAIGCVTLARWKLTMNYVFLVRTFTAMPLCSPCSFICVSFSRALSCYVVYPPHVVVVAPFLCQCVPVHKHYV